MANDRLELVGTYASPTLDKITYEDVVKSEVFKKRGGEALEKKMKVGELAWLWDGEPKLVSVKENVDFAGLTPEMMVKIKEDPVAFADFFFGWKPHVGQVNLLADRKKIVTVAAGRRWGKSESMAIKLIHFAVTRPSYQYIVSLTQDQTRFIFDTADKMLANSPLKSLVKATYSPFPTLDFANGSMVRCYSSAHEGNYLRGSKAHRVIIDEASRIPQGLIDKVVMPMLLDYKGQLILISTPAGHNDFFTYWEKGEKVNDRYSSYRFPTAQNPHIPQEELEEIKKSTSEVVWKTEYEAEFMNDLDFMFKWEVVNRAVDEELALSSVLLPGRNYVMGVDVAKVQDFTVVVVLDVTDPMKIKLAYFDRFNQIEYGEVVERIKRTLAAFQPSRCIVDATGAGNPVVDFLVPEYPQVEGYTFTNALSNPKKYFLMDQLRLGFEQKRLKITDDKVMLEELKFYEVKRDEKTQSIKLGAQSGKHDDCVCALALAWSACSVPAVPLDIVGVQSPIVKSQAEEARVELTYPNVYNEHNYDYYGGVNDYLQ